MRRDELNESAPLQEHPAARDMYRASCADDLMDERPGTTAEEQALCAYLHGRRDEADALLREMTYARRYLLAVACKQLERRTLELLRVKVRPGHD